mmetsp:Transcript_69749/g.182893  ORF Transcript_69749/g.182893 Transcript_69749/m.182893 type:complete len:239 (-) Transcript_69749:75-791(-)
MLLTEFEDHTFCSVGGLATTGRRAGEPAPGERRAGPSSLSSDVGSGAMVLTEPLWEPICREAAPLAAWSCSARCCCFSPCAILWWSSFSSCWLGPHVSGGDAARLEHEERSSPRAGGSGCSSSCVSGDMYPDMDREGEAAWHPRRSRALDDGSLDLAGDGSCSFARLLSFAICSFTSLSSFLCFSSSAARLGLMHSTDLDLGEAAWRGLIRLSRGLRLSLSSSLDSSDCSSKDRNVFL